MQKLLVIGTVAFDNVQTPYDKRDDLLGGSATHFAYSASFFGPVQLVAVVGTDFPQATLDAFGRRGIDCEGVEIVEGKTFRWAGRY